LVCHNGIPKNKTMTKSKSIEYNIMKESLENVEDIENVKILRDEIEFTINSKNPEFGMPKEIEKRFRKPNNTGKEWGIIDFSHIENEDNQFWITVYIKPF